MNILLFISSLYVFITFQSIVYCWVKESEDGTVCFNNCNGHGTCVDYVCQCWPGYGGDDCGTSFVEDGERVVPILTAGHFNITRKNFTTAVTKNKWLLVGFSAYTCHRCIVVEPEYERIAETLLSMKVPFARANVDDMKSIAKEHEVIEVPALILFQKNRPLPYRGTHTLDAVVAYIEKQRAEKPAVTLNTVQDVQTFIESRNSSKYSISTVMVIGFFADYEGVEEDEYEDFLEVANDFRTKEDVYFAVVKDKKTCTWFKQNKTIDRTPSVMMVGEEDARHTINLNELYGESGGLRDWIANNAIPIVGRLSHQNFKLYEKIQKPMLIMFLDLTHEHATNNPGQVIGGKSGGVLNEALLVELREVARELADKMTFVFIDGTKHEDQMRSLGLFGGRERLPSVAFNTRDSLQVPFPEELPINRDTLMQYCADFLSGKLKSVSDVAEMAKKAVQTTRPVNPKNTATRKDRKTAPEQVRGVSEQYGDGTKGDRAVVTVTAETFQEVVMNDEKDVILLLHSQGCEGCAHLAVYYKHMANSFLEQGVTSLVVTRMDITNESPPPELNLVNGALPLVIMLPAGAKHAPWSYFSGVGKAAQMMKWAAAQATIKFDLPSLPHLNDDQRALYKKQIREREEAKAKEEREKIRALKKEEMAQKEFKRSLKKQQKQQQQQQQEPPVEMPSKTADEGDSTTKSDDEGEEGEKAAQAEESASPARRRAARRAAAARAAASRGHRNDADDDEL